ncbi:hypothetical protein BD769DRAFT_1500101 [Suillus cothurnatus]|nr:hypothetical protein BD769DRAFT_1500101 [Suillus cothurnatus]
MFATFPNLFSEVYHFSIGINGLTYIGLGFGFISATIFGVKLSGKIYIYVRQACLLIWPPSLKHISYPACCTQRRKG